MVVIEDEYITGEYVHDLNIKKFTIVNEPNFKEVEFKTQKGTEKKKVLDVQVKIHDTDAIKEWNPNKKAQRRLRAKYGDDTANWKGKEAEFMTVVMNVFGQDKHVINIVE